LWRMTALADGDLRVEQRRSDREWGLVAQTKPPEDEQNEERITSARR
jgi:general secretion pathway protein H